MKSQKSFAIVNALIFDGERIMDSQPVIVEGTTIAKIGGKLPGGIEVIDGRGCMLLPGLIDAHTHTDIDRLRAALSFGVTTEFEMMGHWSAEERKALEEDDSAASVISPGMAVTPPGGHPDELMGGGPPPGFEGEEPPEEILGYEVPSFETPEETMRFVDDLVANGSDFIKIMIEEGTVCGTPGMPMLKNEVIIAAVKQAHKHGKLAVAHALTAAAARQAVEAGMDCLAHVFVDRPADTPELIEAIVRGGVFVTPCLCLNSSLVGNTGELFAADERVHSRLSERWLKTLQSSFSTYPQGKFEDSLANVSDLHKAGVNLLVGTDVSVPVPSLGGLAHGASVHHEMQLLVLAGLSPIEALRSATSIPARCFGLNNRGSIFEGARADLLLVEGDPTVNISDTLNIRHIWRRGSYRGDGKLVGKE